MTGWGGVTKPPIQWALLVLPHGKSGRVLKRVTYLYLLPVLGMIGAVPPWKAHRKSLPLTLTV